MNREIIKPMVGDPVVVVLDHADGVQREGRYGIDFQYTVNRDSGVMWLPPAGRDALLRVNAQAGDSIELVKQKKGNTYTFTARIVGEQHETAAPRQAHPIPARAYYQSGMNGNGHVNGNGNGRAVAPPPAPEQQNDGLLAHCLIDAIEALREAERYGNAHDFEVEFSSEDVRACAITLYLRKVGR